MPIGEHPSDYKHFWNGARSYDGHSSVHTVNMVLRPTEGFATPLSLSWGRCYHACRSQALVLHMAVPMSTTYIHSGLHSIPTNYTPVLSIISTWPSSIVFYLHCQVLHTEHNYVLPFCTAVSTVVCLHHHPRDQSMVKWHYLMRGMFSALGVLS